MVSASDGRVRVQAALLHVTTVASCSHTHVPLFSKQYNLVPAQAGS